jgi:hypothetical protein
VVEYCGQALHTVFADAGFVYFPIWQCWQANFGLELYCPAMHAVHAEAPTASSLSVIDPGGHAAHAVIGVKL